MLKNAWKVHIKITVTPHMDQRDLPSRYVIVYVAWNGEQPEQSS